MGKKQKKETVKVQIPEEYERFLQWWTPLVGTGEIEEFMLIWPHSFPVHKVVLEKGYSWSDFVNMRRELVRAQVQFHDYYGVIKFRNSIITKNAYQNGWTRSSNRQSSSAEETPNSVLCTFNASLQLRTGEEGH